jgi:hypothetical protein
MKPEQQRITIAKACGWHGNLNELHMRPPNVTSEYREVPDYLNDLNAMHEAEKTLDRNYRMLFRNWLAEICKRPGKIPNGVDYSASDWNAVHATAAERAEAFLRTIHKWEEGA